MHEMPSIENAIMTPTPPQAEPSEADERATFENALKVLIEMHVQREPAHAIRPAYAVLMGLWQARAQAAASTFAEGEVELLIGQARISEREAVEREIAAPAGAQPVPQSVLAALDRMCTSLHESRLSGATAAEDARCMQLIREHILAAPPPVAAPTAPDSLQVTALWQDFCRTAAYRRALEWVKGDEVPGALFVAFRAGLDAAPTTQPVAYFINGHEAIPDSAPVWMRCEGNPSFMPTFKRYGLYPMDAAPTAAVQKQCLVALPEWWHDFIVNVCEIPDRNSPDDEPEAMVATAEELENCALNAIEQWVQTQRQEDVSEFVLVPREPTTAMREAIQVANYTHPERVADDGILRTDRIYRAMLAAAPPPQAQARPTALPGEALTDTQLDVLIEAAEAAVKTQSSSPAPFERELRASVAATPATVPPGWKLVPVEPTNAMVAEGAKAGVKNYDEPLLIYRAMLAASTSTPAAAPKEKP